MHAFLRNTLCAPLALAAATANAANAPHAAHRAASAENYAMLDDINAGKLGALVGAHVGGQLTLAQLQAAAALAYGSGAKAGIEYVCIASGGKAYLEEVRFHMRLPSPLPSAVTGAILTRPLRPAASSQLCRANTPIAIRAVVN